MTLNIILSADADIGRGSRMRILLCSSAQGSIDGGEWSASRPGRALPRGKNPGTRWTGGWVGFRAGLDAGARRKILCLCRRLNPGRPVRSQTLYSLSYPGRFSYSSPPSASARTRIISLIRRQA
jgi:hypothetical protein